MRTILIAFFATSTLLAQHEQLVGNDHIRDGFESSTERSIARDLSVSALSLEIYDIRHFDYDAFLEDAKSSENNYRLGEERYRKIALIEIFRKGVLAAESVLEFEQYLKDIDTELLHSISERESVVIYYKFKEGSSKGMLRR